MWSSTVEREELDDPFVELRSWSYALALLVDPAWRRMLGFGFLDTAGELEPGDAYDYRVTGRFRRRDVEERVHGFHAVPRGTTLPTAFALGAVVAAHARAGDRRAAARAARGRLAASGRKGIALAGDRCLTLSFPAAGPRVVLEHDGGASLRWRAQTTDFFPGLPVHDVQRRPARGAPGDARVRRPGRHDPARAAPASSSPSARCSRRPAPKPDEVVTRSVVLNDVVFADSRLPDPPPSLGTRQPPAADPPGRPDGAPPPPASLGFGLHWTPPPPAGAVGAGAVAAPTSARPRRSRRSASASSAGASTRTATVRADRRQGRADARVRLARRPPRSAAARPRRRSRGRLPGGRAADAARVALHVARRRARRRPITHGPAAGQHAPVPDLLRRRARPAVGERRATARSSGSRSASRRRSRRAAAATADAVVPAGVRARVLQALDPDLAAADRTLLGASTNAVVLEWGWTQAERDARPARDRVPRLLAAARAGRRRRRGDRPPDARRRALRDARDARPAARGRRDARPLPLAARLSVQDRRRTPPGSRSSCSSSAACSSRSARPPRRTSSSARRSTAPSSARRRGPSAPRSFRSPPPSPTATSSATASTSTPTHPRARVWVGVSAADAQTYVDDALPAAAPNGGRPGNESAIAPSAATARFLGRPAVHRPAAAARRARGRHRRAGRRRRARCASTCPRCCPRSRSRPAIACSSTASRSTHRRLHERHADDTIGATLPDGATASYTLANPTDQAALLAQIRSGTPARVEDRFLMDFVAALRRPARAAVAGRRCPRPSSFGALTDTLPPKAERYVHRIRIADPAGHVSAGAAIAPQIVRVPSLRSPSPPRADDAAERDGRAARRGPRARRVRLSRGSCCSTSVEDAARRRERQPPRRRTAPAPAQRAATATPTTGSALRLADGTLLAPAAVLERDRGRPSRPTAS